MESSPNAELSRHLGYAPGSDKPDPPSQQQHGQELTGDGKVLIETAVTARAASSRCRCGGMRAVFDHSMVLRGRLRDVRVR